MCVESINKGIYSGLLGLLGTLLLATLGVHAQESSLIIQGTTAESGVALNWFPTDAQQWEDAMATGYRLSRVEIDLDSNEIGAPVVLLEALLPKDSAWFAENYYLVDGLMEPIGALLYDPQFDFPENDLMDDTDMKYNFLVFESTLNTEIAEALGLGMLDTTVEYGKHYRYDVTTINGELTASVKITTIEDIFVESQENPVEFTFPGDRSLSDMYEAAHPKDPNKIVAIGRAYGDTSIVLRWGPTNPRLWQSALENGYEIYRAEGDGEFELLDIVKPWPDSQFTQEITDSIAVYDSIALMAAGILYSDNSDYDIENMNVSDRISLFENSFGFALYAADRSSMAADILGLRYEDLEVTPDSIYSYLITTDGIEDPFQMGRITKSAKEVPVPYPVELTAQPGEKVIRLVWSKAQNEKFSSFVIERSEDGENYYPLNERPLVFLETDDLPITEYSYVDSVGVNDKTYYYQLGGYDSFGDLSIGAEASAMARDFTPPFPVTITKSDYLKASNQFLIEWEEQQEPAADLESYQVLMSNELEGFYSAISPVLSTDSSRFLLDIGELDLDQIFYFSVQSQDVNGNISRSYSGQIAVPDLTAPLAPENLIGYVDTFSFVHLSWDHSTSKDAVGYWVYWGNNPNDELAPVNTRMITENSLTWYIEDVSFLKKIYVTVRAEDDALNRGFPAEVLAITRLDKIAPVKPFLNFVRPVEGALEIEWEPSASNDVVGQQLYRSSNADTTWQILDTLSAAQTIYRDSLLEIGETYFYQVVANDASGNYSEPSATKEGRVPFPDDQVKVTDLKVMASSPYDSLSNRLTWSYLPPNGQLADLPYQFEIYRSTGGEIVEFLASTDGTFAEFEDRDISTNILYNYAVRIRYENGWLGDLSEVKSVLIPEGSN